jgi:hypothetical protein
VARPDAFRPGLAMALTNLAGWLGELGRQEEALDAIQKAVIIHRELAVRWPMPTATSWITCCKLLPGLSTAKTSVTHPRESLRSDNGPLSLHRESAAYRWRARLEAVTEASH